MTDESGLSRRAVLGGVAAGASASLAGCPLLGREPDAPVSTVEPERARELAETYAPTLYFDSEEPWFPTDPRPYESEQDGRTVVSGFDALEGYVSRSGEGEPPDPTVFYQAIEYEGSPLTVVQFWFYSVFDQFTTNFHWHDWELLQVFVNTETEEPQLYVASSHSRKVPNNEFLDPSLDRQPRILAELGSHSSGLSVNEQAEHFERVPLSDDVADITNSAIEGLGDLASIALAYGLPRDEGLPLPYVVPDLNDTPVYEDERLPSVEASDLVHGDLTIRSFDDLTSPPANIPTRSTGTTFGLADGDGVDVVYDLLPTSEVEHIDDFVGPQLSFEFLVPDFAEDLIAGHITTSGPPWKDERYTEPASDISEPRHRQALADRFSAISEPSPVNQIIAAVRTTASSPDAPADEGIQTESSSVESVALLESEPEAVPTFQGVAVVQNVPEGEHRLTVNGAGAAPHSETVAVGSEGQTAAGVEGEIPLVARENATKLEVDPTGADSDLTDFAVEDDFAGRLYDAPLPGKDAVYVDRRGAYTTEVRDRNGAIGADRVNPADKSGVRLENPRTGKVSLANYLADIAEETRAEVAAVADDGDSDSGPGNGQGGGPEGPVTGLARALQAVTEAAQRAAERAAAGDRGNANQSLETVASRLEQVASRLAEAQSDLPPGLANATENRLGQARKRAEQARSQQKL